VFGQTQLNQMQADDIDASSPHQVLQWFLVWSEDSSLDYRSSCI
jgi:hypothetical protein